MRHLLGIEELSREELLAYIENAYSFAEVSDRDIKKVPALRGKTVVNLFFEPSTRTRASFEIAGKRLSADVINVGGSASSTTKGESLLDTAMTIESMQPDVVVVRHKASGAPHFIAKHMTSTSVVNAGDGMHEHPTQALLDCLTLRAHFGEVPVGKTIAIVGDIRHSRVARSNVFAHILLGNKIRLVGPTTLVPHEFSGENCFGNQVEICNSLEEGLEGADVVMVLRMQLERQNQGFVPSIEEYTRAYCVNEQVLAKCAPKSVILHPGPANRGLEISSEVLEGPRSLVRKQVHSGVAVRMAVLFSLIVGSQEVEE